MDLRLTVLCAVIVWTCVSGGKMTRIKARLKRLEVRQRRVAISRLEEVTGLSDRLDALESQLNAYRADSTIKSNEDIAIAPCERLEETCKSMFVTQERLDAVMMRLLYKVEKIEETVNRTRDDVNALQKRINEIEHFQSDNVSNVDTEYGSTHSSKTATGRTKSSKTVIGRKKNSKTTNSTTNALRKPNSSVRYDSCLSLYGDGFKDSGVYTIYPVLEESGPVTVYCDMVTDGGGWTVFQRRQDGSVDFYRTWQDYKHGFGNVCGEFWLGNDHISVLTRKCCHELRIELEDFDGGEKYAKYGIFKVLPESSNYKLIVANGSFSADVGDSLTFHNNMEFTTKDRDNTRCPDCRCAESYMGAWWYDGCHLSNLNGLYLRGETSTRGKGVVWYTWRGDKYSLKMTEMKLRYTGQT